MIPHIIHYCWFGGKEKPQEVNGYIEGWKKILPDYEFIEWNENNFPINYCEYTKEAYDAKKYAFVSDVARLYGLSQYGGIYFDTDVELLKRFDEYLNSATAIFSLESESLLMTGFMAGEKGLEIFDSLLSEYKERTFINANGTKNCIANTVYLTELMVKRGLSFEREWQIIDNSIYIYDYTTFGGFNADKSTFEVTDKTILIHHCMASWETGKGKVKLMAKKWMAKHFSSIYESLRNIKKKRNCQK